MIQEGVKMKCPNCRGEILKGGNRKEGNFYHCKTCGTVIYRRHF